MQILYMVLSAANLGPGHLLLLRTVSNGNCNCVHNWFGAKIEKQSLCFSCFFCLHRLAKLSDLQNLTVVIEERHQFCVPMAPQVAQFWAS
eukprot:SAG22_NODE_62_length_23371_cov_84.500602_17_plen_90_part_00